jgi:putative DNA primase/helicase
MNDDENAVETVAVNAAAIPDELQERDQWLMWDASADAPRRPHWRGDFSVSWTDPADWHTFEEAVEAAQERSTWGIGYVFARDNEDYARGLYGALDLDGCIDEDGHPKEWLPSLQPFFDAGAYMESSPSGTGIHIPLVGFEPPEWWSDVHFTDDEHEGIEAYGSKFFTFTGDRLRNCGDEVAATDEFVEDWLIEGAKAVTGDDPIKEQTHSFEDVSEGGRAHRDEFLEEDDIRDALDHINPDVGYGTWRDIAFALDDFFTSKRTALSVFEDWSRGGSKWDGKAADQAERIISDATSGGGRTIGMVIHHAREGGWEMPTPSSSSRSKRTPTPSPTDEGETDTEETDEESDYWSSARTAFAAKQPKHGRYYAAAALMEAKSWMYVLESERLWVYEEDSGCFTRWGEQYATHVLERLLGEQYSRTDCAEIIDRIQARSQTHRKDLDAGTQDGSYLCVGNGVVDLETGDLQPHSPDFKFTRGLTWDYDPERADPSPVLDFLDDITKREADRDTLLDHLAHGLMPGHPYRAFVLMHGPGANGKTQLGQIFRGFVGEDNAASVELQDLTGDDAFATGGLPGAFVNVGDDISVSEIRDVSILKSLTGSGTIRANEKYEKQYEFTNEAAMFFSANEPPRISEESAAIGDRLYPIEMPYRFKGENEYDPDNPLHKEKIPGIAARLLENEGAMRGLLMLCVEHAQRLIASKGQYSMPEGPEQRREMYEAASDPIRRFALDYLEGGEASAVVLKDDAYAVYNAMCETQDERVASENGFKRQITQQSIIDVENALTRQLSPGDDQETCWRYVKFNDEAKEIMPDRLVSRYFPGEESDESAENDEDTREDETSGEQAVFGAEPISSAAEALTGFVTVTAEVAGTRRLTDDDRGVEAKLKDATGGIKAIAWDDDVADHLEDAEGGHIALKLAEVSEYEGTRQLKFDEDMTELVEIQAGVGYTEGADAGVNQQVEAAADGGVQTVEESPDEDKEAATDETESDTVDADEETTLVHCKRDEHDSYVGRGATVDGGTPDGISDKHSMANTSIGERGWLGNPYPEAEYGREECIELFEEDFLDRIERDAEFRRAVEELRGETLACWCVPEACHGEVIIEFLDGDDETDAERATADANEETDLGSLLPRGLMFVRDNHGDRSKGVPHYELVEKLEEHGATESQANHAIEKLLSRGEINEPVLNYYRA